MNNKLIIVWKPDVLSMVEHAGNNDNYKGLTARSQVESFSNIKTVDAAKRLILRRNVNEMIFASFNGEEINVHPPKKERITFYKKLKRKIKSLYSNDYSNKIKVL